jgi:hypothetical protein
MERAIMQYKILYCILLLRLTNISHSRRFLSGRIGGGKGALRGEAVAQRDQQGGAAQAAAVTEM